MACQWALELCQTCWLQGIVPEKWHEARVAMIYKKGDVAECGNYRSISLLQIRYKPFATVLLLRLKEAGAEACIWGTQFGFCSGRGTLDAVFLARRMIEEANALKDKRLVLLALDWAKAFDSISPEALCHSLKRFGLPEEFLRSIKAIYANRRLSVSDCGGQSSFHCQNFGICQGCPLSPFLFGMLMTVLISDAKALLESWGTQLSGRTVVNELLYADDTLLIDVDSAVAEQYMQCVRRAGSTYGLALNWKKLELVSTTDIPSMRAPTGDAVKH